MAGADAASNTAATVARVWRFMGTPRYVAWIEPALGRRRCGMVVARKASLFRADPDLQRCWLQSIGGGVHGGGARFAGKPAHDRQRQAAVDVALGRGEGGEVALVAVVGGDQFGRAFDVEAHAVVRVADRAPLRVEHAQGDEG